MPYIARDPLKYYVNIYKSTSFKSWIEQGFLDDFIYEMLDAFNKQVSKGDVFKYLPIMNEIIPSLPKQIEVMFGDRYDFEKKLTQIKTDVSTCYPLISSVLANKIYYNFKRIIDRINSVDGLNLLNLIILKSFYHASNKIMRENSEEINNILMDMKMSIHFHKVIGHSIFLDAFYILIERKSTDITKSILKSDMALKTFFHRNHNENKQVNKLQTLYYYFYNYKTLEKTFTSHEERQCFISEDEFFNSLAEWANSNPKLIQLLDENFIDIIIQNDLSVFYKNNDSIKRFLRIVLNIKTSNNFQCSWNGEMFQILVIHIKGIIEWILGKFTNPDDETPQDNKNHNKLTNMEQLFYGLLDMLNNLYVWNSSWNQYFDIIDALPIIDDKSLSLYFQCDRKLLNKCNPCFLRTILERCPVIAIFNKYLKFSLSNKAGQYDSHFVISRTNVFESFEKIFKEEPNKTCHKWSFRFLVEFGDGIGLTKEAYSVLSRELQQHELNMWNGESMTSNDGKSYTDSVDGLFPKKSSENIEKFYFFGKILAKAFMDRHQLDINLSDEFFQQLCDSRFLNLRNDHYNIKNIFPLSKQVINQLIEFKRVKNIIQSESAYTDAIRKDIIRNLTLDDGHSFEDLFLNFTIPGTDIELKDGGKDIILSPFNVEEYLNKLSDAKHFPREQIEAVKMGFEEILPQTLNYFTAKELKMLVCGEQVKQWTVEELKSSCHLQRYDKESKVIKYLFEVLASFNQLEQKMFLMFVTSRTTLPIYGFEGLTLPLQISKLDRDNPDCSLPKASTCINNLLLPEYSSIEVTRTKLLYAINECRGFFK